MWDEQPVLLPDEQPVMDAFRALSGDRAMGFGAVGSIPFMAIDRYAERYDIEDFERFHRLIRAMDAAYIEHMNERKD